MRALCFYALSVIILSVYGGQVCPYLESLQIWTWAGVLTGTFLTVYLFRIPLEKRCVDDADPVSRLTCQLYMDLGLFTTVGILITIFNFGVFNFPFDSGIKVVLGTASLGLFSSIDLALARERTVLERAEKNNETLKNFKKKSSISRKFSIVALLSISFVTAILLMVVLKDLKWMYSSAAPGPEQARRVVIIEVLFVMVIVLGFIVHLIFSYTKNLRMLFETHTSVLEEVKEGNLDQYVPVSSNDEFGEIASHTNKMIDGLRERQKVKNIFGKVVSSEVANQLLDREDEEVRLGGERQDVVLLMSDIRNFTDRTERTEPEQLVDDLNQYFSTMVEVIQDHGGMVDKFLGDGILAVFGLQEDPVEPEEKATHAAIEMQRKHETLNKILSEPMETGIAVHTGTVIAGNIGSKERLEFTVIGDAVNTVSRMEGLTSDLGCRLLLSEDVYNVLPKKLKQRMKPFGQQPVRGKEKQVSIYGIPSEEGMVNRV